MLHLIGDIVKYFSFDETNIDNWVFKLFYKGCFILFLCGSMVGILSQYFGEPINCDFKGIDSEMASDYCWIHGSSYIPPEYQQHLKCIVDLDGVDSADDAPDTSYYQWVTFFMMIQAGTFMLPYKIWRALEGGLLEEFGLDAKSAIMLKEDYGDALVLESIVEKYVKYFKSIFHRNNYYFAKYLACEGLNIIILFLNFYITDLFLNGNFWYYGWDVIQYNRMPASDRRNAVNPMCRAFPLEVSCTVPNVGAAGGEQNHNGLCVLSQNIINEKMYLAIWFWLVFLIIITPLCIIYRLLTVFFDGFRSALLMSKIGNTNDKLARKSIKMVMGKCYLGDWFVLYQISKNVNMYFFRAFMKELKHEISKGSKKQSFLEKNKFDNSSLLIPHAPKADLNVDDEEEGTSSTDESLPMKKPSVASPTSLPQNKRSLTKRSHSIAVPEADEAAKELSIQDRRNHMRKMLLQSRQSYKLNRMLPGKGHHGRRVGNKKRTMSGVDDFEIDMMLSI